MVVDEDEQKPYELELSEIQEIEASEEVPEVKLLSTHVSSTLC